MTMEVDLAQKRIRASIGDLAESNREGPRGVGLLIRLRASLGTAVHERYRTDHASQAGFRSEVPVTLRLTVDGFEALLAGRIDGLWRIGEQRLVEEVKSVAIGGAELARLPLEAFPDFCQQVRLYCLALAAGGGPPPLARLLLVSLLDDSRRTFDLDPALESTRAWLIDRLRECIADARREQQRAQHLAELAAALRFPYPEMRPHQAELTEAMSAGLQKGQPVLAMAPTGIGKTASALTAGLRFALARPAPLYFATAKNTQQRLVGQTFETLCRASRLPPGALHALVLRAKERMCPPGHLLCHPEVCPFLTDFAGRLENGGARESLLGDAWLIEPDMVFATGEAHGLCPHALSLALLDGVDLIVGDYNYLYDPAVALSQLVGEAAVAPPVVVVDEAHNLFDRAREYYSPFLWRRELAELRGHFASGEWLAPADRSDQLVLRELLGGVDGPALFGELDALASAVDGSIEELLGQAREDALAFEGRREVLPDPQPWRVLGERAEALLVSYVLYNRSHRLVRPRDPVTDWLLRLGRVRDVLAIGGEEFVPHVATETDVGFGILCVNPAERLAERHRQMAGTVAMSATLTPLGYWADVLGLSGLEPLRLTLPSPFPRENLGVFIDASLTTTFQQRDRYRAAIARTLERTVGARPGRYVAYFPSYRFLQAVLGELRLPARTVLVQEPGRNITEHGRLLEDFTGGGPSRLLLAVMGGVFAEGIDLPGEQLIGAIVVGPGLPQVGFERAAMQAYFERRTERGFAYAMLYPGMQRVIQAAGRVIRSPEDQGVIVLLDRRFAQAEVFECLPPHWHTGDPADLIADDLEETLRRFWDRLGA